MSLNLIQAQFIVNCNSVYYQIKSATEKKTTVQLCVIL